MFAFVGMIVSLAKGNQMTALSRAILALLFFLSSAAAAARPVFLSVDAADRMQLEHEAAVLLEHIQQLDTDRLYEEEVLALRHLMALRAEIGSINEAPGSTSDSAMRIRSRFAWISASNLLGKALYKTGHIADAESVYLAVVALLQHEQAEDKTSKELPLAWPFERHMLIAKVLAGQEVAARSELDRVEKASISSEKSASDADREGIERDYADALLIRADALCNAGQLNAADLDFQTAVARLSSVGSWGALAETVAVNRYETALTRRAQTLEASGDRIGASAVFHKVVELLAARLPSGDVAIVVARNNAASADALKNRDPDVTLLDVIRVFPSLLSEAKGADYAEVISDFTHATHKRLYEVAIKWLGPDSPEAIQDLGFYAFDMRQNGQPELASQLQALVVERTAKLLGENSRLTVAARDVLARDLDKIGKHDEAVTQMTIVVDADAKQLAIADRDAMFATSFLHDLLYQKKDYAKALPYVEMLARAAKLPQTGNDVEKEFDEKVLGEPIFALDRVALDVASDLRPLGRFAEAETWDRQSRDLRFARFGPNSPNTSIPTVRLATDVLAQPGRESEAYRLATQSYAQFASLARKLWADYEVADHNGFRSYHDLADQARSVLLDSAYQVEHGTSPERTGNAFFEGVFAAAQDDFYSSAALAVAHSAGRRYAMSVGAAALSERREKLASDMEDALAALDRVENSSAATVADEDAANARIQTLERAFTRLDLQLKKAAPLYGSIVSQPALSVSAAKRLMGPTEAVLLIVPTERGTHLIVVSNDAIAWNRSSLTAADLSKLVERLRQDLDPAIQYDNAFDRKTAYTLYEALIKPVASSLAGKTTLYVVSGGALAQLPLSVLITDPPAPGSNDADPETMRRAPWLSNTFALVQLPSLQTLAYEREFTTRADDQHLAKIRSDEFAGFGDPDLAGQAAMRGARGALKVADPGRLIDAATDGPASDAARQTPMMDPDLLRSLARLPGTRIELEAMRQMLGANAASLHLGRDMREGILREADLTRIRVLHIATHGLTAGESGARAEPGLVFTPPLKPSVSDDGYLAASEVAALQLPSVEWVILSACNSAAPAGAKDQSGLSGLARAFILAGAKSLLVSYWPVDDQVSARLTVDILRRERGGTASRAQALQQAMRAIREDRSNPQFAYPSAWAPFALVGEGR